MYFLSRPFCFSLLSHTNNSEIFSSNFCVQFSNYFQFLADTGGLKINELHGRLYLFVLLSLSVDKTVSFHNNKNNKKPSLILLKETFVYTLKVSQCALFHCEDKNTDFNKNKIVFSL